MVKFFISSTFRDMFGERNLLHKEILPKLREFGELLGEYVDICDLRWGIDHGEAMQQEKTNLIAEVCLNEIEASDPYFIVFLGDYYGTVPKKEVNIKILEDDKSWVFSDISLTQIEVEYAILRKQIDDSVEIKPICLFRDWNHSESFTIEQTKEDLDKQKKLRESLYELEQMNKITAIHYSACWDSEKEEAVNFGEMPKELQKKAEEIIQTAAGATNPKNWIEQEFLRAKGLCSQYKQSFGGREELIAEIKDAVCQDGINTICISGPSGCGKSALMAVVSLEIEEVLKQKICLVACGHGERSRRYLEVLKQLTYFVEMEMNPEYKISNAYLEEKAENELKKAIKKYEKTGTEHLVLLVDALDKVDAYSTVKLHSLIEGMDIRKITIICSRIEMFHNNAETVKSIQIQPLNQSDLKEIVRKDVSRDDNHFNNIVNQLSKKQDAGSPLYITAAMNILHMKAAVAHNESDLFTYYGKVIEEMPEKTEELIWNNIETAESYLENSFGERIAAFLAAAQYGLREVDLEGLFEYTGKKDTNMPVWQTVRFLQFRRYLNRFFRCQSNGCWTFNHDIIKESVRNKLKHADRLSEYKTDILNYMKTIKQNDEVRITEGLWACMDLGEYEFAEMILKDAVESPDVRIHTLATITLHDIGKDIKGENWYCALVEKYPAVVEVFLNQGLMHRGAASFERRYPAKELADCYMNFCNRRILQKNLLKVLEEKRSLEEKIQFSSFCAEYVGIYEDISRQWEAFPYEIPVYELICNRLSFSKLSDVQKRGVFKQVNGVFYANNRILNDIRKKKIPAVPSERKAAEKISKEFIRWYEENIENEKESFEGKIAIEGKFVNNMAQYYSAHEEYEFGQTYRMKALKLKIFDFLHEIEQEDKLLSEMEEMIADGYGIKKHKEYWKKVGMHYNSFVLKRGQEDEAVLKRKRSAAAKWIRVAVSYRGIGTDYFNRDGLKRNDDFLQTAYENMALCLEMLNNPILEGDQKEKIISEIRMVGIGTKFFQRYRNSIADREGDFVTFIKNTIHDLMIYKIFDKREAKNLKENIDRYKKELPEDSEYWRQLQNAYRKMNEKIEEEDYYDRII